LGRKWVKTGYNAKKKKYFHDNLFGNELLPSIKMQKSGNLCKPKKIAPIKIAGKR